MRYNNQDRNRPAMKALFSFLLLFGCLIFYGCAQSNALKLESRSADSLDDLIVSIKEAYSKGDHYTIMTYMDNESIEPDLAQAIAQSLSLGANPSEDNQLIMEAVSWEDFKNTSGIPGSFKGKELRFKNEPNGVIKIVTVNEKAGSRYTIDLAYFSEGSGYRLCGIAYK